MTAMVLAGWMTFAGTIGGDKLAEGWAIVCRTFQKPATRPEMDWTEYYKRQGSQINGYPVYGPSCTWTSPTMQWAVPSSCLNGPPVLSSGIPAHREQSRPAAREFP